MLNDLALLQPEKIDHIIGSRVRTDAAQVDSGMISINKHMSDADLHCAHPREHGLKSHDRILAAAFNP